MQFDAELNLLEAAVRLRGEAPSVYDNFTAAMRAYAAKSSNDMLRVPTELLQRAQGMAIATNDIAMLLTAAHQLLEQRRSRNGPRTPARSPGASLPS